jgi:hypothetical protein
VKVTQEKAGESSPFSFLFALAKRPPRKNPDLSIGIDCDGARRLIIYSFKAACMRLLLFLLLFCSIASANTSQTDAHEHEHSAVIREDSGASSSGASSYTALPMLAVAAFNILALFIWVFFRRRPAQEIAGCADQTPAEASSEHAADKEQEE